MRPSQNEAKPAPSPARPEPKAAPRRDQPIFSPAAPVSPQFSPDYDEPPTKELRSPVPLPRDSESDDSDSNAEEVPGFETDDSLEEEAPTVAVAWHQVMPPEAHKSAFPHRQAQSTRELKGSPLAMPSAAATAAPLWTSEPILDEASYFEDDDLEEQTFEQPFDLAAELLKKPTAVVSGAKEPYCAAHVVRVVRDHITQTASVLPGQSFTSHTKELHCTLQGQKILIRTLDNVTGELRRGGTVASLADVPIKRKWRKVMLQEGDDAMLRGAEGSYRIEVYRPPLAVRSSKVRLERSQLVVLAAAVAIHLIAAAVVGIATTVSKQAEQATEQEVFAEVKMKQPELTPPPEQPDKPAPKKDTLAMSEKAPAVSSKTMRRIEKKLSGTGGTRKPPSSVNNLVDRLMGGGGGKNPSNKSLKELVSNIDAVAPSARGGSPFGIAGAIASLPGGGVNIARSGSGGDVATLSGDQVAGTGSGVATLDREKRSGAVRGKVTKMTSGSSVKGSLSKEDVARVVNGNVHMLQACYEKGLLSDPGLAGRIAFDWTVGKDGRVKGTRVRSSTLGSAKVADCMMTAIKKWKFPKPTGGDAEITFPFMFRSVSS